MVLSKTSLDIKACSATETCTHMHLYLKMDSIGFPAMASLYLVQTRFLLLFDYQSYQNTDNMLFEHHFSSDYTLMSESSAPICGLMLPVHSSEQLFYSDWNHSDLSLHHTNNRYCQGYHNHLYRRFIDTLHFSYRFRIFPPIYKINLFILKNSFFIPNNKGCQ